MSEMIERVANAMMKADWLDEREPPPNGDLSNYYSMARAAIEAMREPTQAMIEIGMQEFQDPCWPENVKIGFSKMIDAALGDKP